VITALVVCVLRSACAFAQQVEVENSPDGSQLPTNSRTPASLPAGYVIPGGRAPTGLPEAVEQALSTIEDHSFKFDQPGFYALLRHVKESKEFFDPDAPPLKEWKVLMERPTSFRGRPVTVEGRVGRNSSYEFEREEHKLLGPVTELQIATVTDPVSCRIILTNDAGDVPIGATVRVTGYFLMAHQYLAPNKRPMQNAIIVSKGPLQVMTTRTRPPLMPQPGWAWLIGALVIGGLVGWAMLRQTAKENRSDLRALQARTPPVTNVSKEFQEWAARQARETPPKPDDFQK
jgi:hypothetical protein